MRLAGTGAASAGSRVRRHSSGMPSDDDEEDDQDDDDEDDNDDDEEDEDADFEAPVAGMLLHTLPRISIEDTGMSHAHQLQLSIPLTVDDNSDRPRQHGDLNLTTDPEGAVDESVESVEQPVDDMERLLLPLLELPEHIPAQCPPFPSPHTYKQTPVLPEREQDFFRNRVRKAEQSRQAEENLQKLINGPRHHDHGKSPSNSSGVADTQAPEASVGDTALGDGAQSKQAARKRLENMFPPANFCSTYKRTRLAGYIK
ncbi:hypothetical protein IWW38_005958 [Coemansia aciculifera]|uniref:Uncharacterized protein n=1 Tax=Coemansia aciculifera TaxID=417176 RepID=A0ACC1LTM0_9FUNG|nr:hypothetical protein IWW38_005958 [Coemansia aciculifera]